MKEECLDSWRILGDDGLDRRTVKRETLRVNAGQVRSSVWQISVYHHVDAAIGPFKEVDRARTRIQRGSCLLNGGAESHDQYFVLPARPCVDPRC